MSCNSRTHIYPVEVIQHVYLEIDFFFIEFTLPCHAFQTRHVCFSMHNSLNIVSIICNFSTMLALQR